MSIRQLIVVGAGASGLMAAGQAAAHGAETLLLEKMDRPGVKLRITGQGRCNITNVAPIREAIKRFVAGAHFVRPALYSFSPDDLRAFFGELGVPTGVQRGGRVFILKRLREGASTPHWGKKACKMFRELGILPAKEKKR